MFVRSVSLVEGPPQPRHQTADDQSGCQEGTRCYRVPRVGHAEAENRRDEEVVQAKRATMELAAAGTKYPLSETRTRRASRARPLWRKPGVGTDNRRSPSNTTAVLPSQRQRGGAKTRCVLVCHMSHQHSERGAPVATIGSQPCLAASSLSPIGAAWRVEAPACAHRHQDAEDGRRGAGPPHRRREPAGPCALYVGGSGGGRPSPQCRCFESRSR